VNSDLTAKSTGEGSAIYVELLIDEKWIDNMINEYQFEIPVNEKITLSNLRVQIGVGILNILADLKEESTINVTAQPVWNEAKQELQISDLKLKTDTKNVLLKSAGIFAQMFLNAKIDKKIEEQVNRMYAKQLDKLKSKPVEVPIPKGGKARVMISDINVHNLEFLDQAIRIKATIHGVLKVHLSNVTV
jgi:hypothetical protein